MDRNRNSRWLLVTALAACWPLAGCSESRDGDFKSYSELESPERTAGGEAASPGSDERDAAARNGSDSGGGAATPDPDGGGLKSAGSNGADPAPPEEEVVQAPPAAGEATTTASPAVAATGADADDAPDNSAADLDRDPAIARLMPPSRADPPVEAPRPEPREIELLVPHREFRVEGPEGAIRVSYDDIDLLKVLNMEPVPADCAAYFPDWLRNLDGRRIRIRGFMFPPFETTGIRGFVLARDNQICCMGRDPKRYDVIDVFLRRSVTTDYISNRPFDVVGVLHIQPEADDGELYQLYVIDDAIVIDR